MRLSTSLFKNTSPKIEYYSRFSPSPLSIKQFLEFGECKVMTWLVDLACLLLLLVMFVITAGDYVGKNIPNMASLLTTAVIAK